MYNTYNYSGELELLQPEKRNSSKTYNAQIACSWKIFKYRYMVYFYFTSLEVLVQIIKIVNSGN